jgi:hypothetical protein
MKPAIQSLAVNEFFKPPSKPDIPEPQRYRTSS